MRTKLDHVKKQIDAGLFEVGAVIDVALANRSWTPVVEHQKHVALLAERVDKIMDQQTFVDYMICISGDFRQIGVLYTFPQNSDLFHADTAKRNGPDQLKGLVKQVDKQLLDASRRVKNVMSIFKSGKDQSIETVSAELGSAANPEMAEELLRQTRNTPAVIELARGKVRVGGSRDDVPEKLHALHDCIVEFIPTRGIPGGHPNCSTYGQSNCSTLATALRC